MSRSRKKIKRKFPGDGCWLCDSTARQQKYYKNKNKPDSELIAEIKSRKMKGKDGI